MSIRRPLPVLVLLSSFFAPAAAAQSLNVDCGSAPAPSATYGAAAGQPGVWNQLGMPADQPLIGLDGVPTSASVTTVGCDNGGCFDCGLAHACPGLSGTADDEALLGSWFNGDCQGTPHEVHLYDLEPGTYRLHVYSYRGCTPHLNTNYILTVRRLRGGFVSFQSDFSIGGAAFQGTFTSAHTTSRVIDFAAGDTVELRGSNGYGGLAGFQLVRIDWEHVQLLERARDHLGRMSVELG